MSTHAKTPHAPHESHTSAEPDVRLLARQARDASRPLAALDTVTKDRVLERLAQLIVTERDAVRAANAQDLDLARAAGLPAPKLQRLALSAASLNQIAEGIRQVAALPDPVGQITREHTVPSGLRVRRVRAPLGVVAMIYEARPGVTVDAFALCFKSGNACILRGGREAQRSNAALAALAHRALFEHNAPEAALVNISGSGRDTLATLLTLDKDIDLVIPRGGRELIELVTSTSRIPTVQHFQGVCHIYVDQHADLDKALNICLSAKTSAPATCNAAECVLVHRSIADRFVPAMLERYHAAGVEVRATPLVVALAAPQTPTVDDGFGSTGLPGVKLARPEDFGKEFLDLIVAMRTVDTLDEAVEHIQSFGSNHTEAIITEDRLAADEFTRRVHSSCVVVNASTRFNDGFQLGLGAEIGISTSRIHAYGPMGLEELTTQRWIAIGDGHTR